MSIDARSPLGDLPPPGTRASDGDGDGDGVAITDRSLDHDSPSAADEPSSVDPNGSTSTATRDAGSPAASLGYQPALDGLRGLALLAIIVYHSELTAAPGAFLSVSTFFTLSGFLITALALAEHQRSGRFSLRLFWSRRFRRLLPAAIAAIAAILLVGFLLADATQRARMPGDAVASLFYVANWRFIFSGESYGAIFQSPSPFTHFWTLSIEEQFYLLFPLVLGAALLVGRGSRRALAIVFGSIVAAGTIWSAVLLARGATIDRIYFGTDTRLAELVAGSLLAVWWMRPGRRRGNVRMWAIIGVAALALMLVLWVTADQQQRVFYGGGLTLYAGLTILVIIGALQPRGPVRLLLGLAPIVWVGQVSYAAYLLHWPILVWLDRGAGLSPSTRFVVGLALTLAIAALFTRVVERPIRSGHRLPGRRATIAAPVAIVAVLLLAIVSERTAPPDTSSVDFAQVQSQLDALAALDKLTPEQKEQWGEWARTQEKLALATAPRVAFFGDSTSMLTGFGFNDWAFKGDLQQLAPQAGSSQLGCGLLTGGQRIAQNRPGPALPDCDTYVDNWRKAITENQVDIAVVQFGPWDVLDQTVAPDDRFRTISQDAELDQALEAKLEANSRLLLERTKMVVLVAPPDIVSGMVDQRPPTVAYPESDPARMERFRQIVRSVADRLPHVAVVELGTWLDDRPDRWRLRPDGIHPTEQTSSEIGMWIGPEILRLWTADQAQPGGT